MKTAVIGEDANGLVIYNRALLDLARHYGFQPRACRPYRAKTKSKVERPFRYIREDFFLGGVFRNLDDLNEQLRHWLDTVANPRVQATANRVVTWPGRHIYTASREELETSAADLFDAIRDGVVNVGPTRTYAFDDIVSAHRDLENRRIIGAAVIEP